MEVDAGVGVGVGVGTAALAARAPTRCTRFTEFQLASKAELFLSALVTNASRMCTTFLPAG